VILQMKLKVFLLLSVLHNDVVSCVGPVASSVTMNVNGSEEM